MANHAPSGKLHLDPELHAILAPKIASGPPRVQAKTIEEFIAKTNVNMATMFTPEYPPEILITHFSVPDASGYNVPLTRFAASEQSSATSQPAMVAIFGGGFVCGSVDLYKPHYARLAAATGVQIWAVDYRLAPAHRAPAQIEDCWTALKWLSEHALEHGVDPARIGIYGESAGGGLVVGLSLMARDRGLSPPVKQVVAIYPKIDDRTTLKYADDDWDMAPFLVVSKVDSDLCWDAILGPGVRNTEEVSLYYAPGRAKAADLKGLPNYYLDVGGLDLYRDEILEFGKNLAEACVQVELHLWAGLPHGFDVTYGPTVTKMAWDARYRFIKTL